MRNHLSLPNWVKPSLVTLESLRRGLFRLLPLQPLRHKTPQLQQRERMGETGREREKEAKYRLAITCHRFQLQTGEGRFTYFKSLGY
jgi:hypothetical protein